MYGNFAPGSYIHCYQRASKGFLLFYNVRDYLEFYTLFCVIARKYKIVIVKLCLMPDHIHFVAIVDSKETLARFVQAYASIYAKRVNKRYHHSGKVFEKTYGAAVKKGGKRIRTCLTYVDNNPVERRLVSNAEDYMWGFIRYSVSDNPFSEPLIVRTASIAHRKSIAQVNAMLSAGSALSYKLLGNIFEKLDKQECAQMTDYIISRYSVIDHRSSISMFGSYEKMIAAAHNNTGSEHDIKEKFQGKTDKVYNKMTQAIMEEYGLKDIHEVLRWSEQTRLEMIPQLALKSGAGMVQAAKYLHVNVEVKR